MNLSQFDFGLGFMLPSLYKKYFTSYLTLSYVLNNNIKINYYKQKQN